MNEAMVWAVEKSKVGGAGLAVLLAIAKRVEGCVARVRPGELLAEARIGRRLYYECMLELERFSEAQRITSRYDGSKLRAFHLPKYCETLKKFCVLADIHCARSVDGGNLSSPLLATPAEVCTDPILQRAHLSCGKENAVEIARLTGWQLNLFQKVLTVEQAREECEECRGTGWMWVTWKNKDGGESSGQSRCGHGRAGLVGKWRLARSDAEDKFPWARGIYCLPPKPVRLGEGQRVLRFGT